jgi:hypothetical protein
MSRTASNNTTVQSRQLGWQRNPPPVHTKQSSRESNLRQSYQATDYQRPEPPKSPIADQSSSSSSSSDSESEQPNTRPHQPFKRAGRFSSTRTTSRPIESSGSLRNDDGDEDDETPAFLPYSRPKQADTTLFTDPSATLRMAPGRPSVQRRHPTSPAIQNTTPHSSTSSGSSAAIPQTAPTSQNETTRIATRPTTTGPLSPHRQAELSKLSPRRRAAAGREGSDGTPSMGSSFSDLDGTDVYLQ